MLMRREQLEGVAVLVGNTVPETYDHSKTEDVSDAGGGRHSDEDKGGQGSGEERDDEGEDEE
jgi:hypothetical protein